MSLTAEHPRSWLRPAITRLAPGSLSWTPTPEVQARGQGSSSPSGAGPQANRKSATPRWPVPSPFGSTPWGSSYHNLWGHLVTTTPSTKTPGHRSLDPVNRDPNTIGCVCSYSRVPQGSTSRRARAAIGCLGSLHIMSQANVTRYHETTGYVRPHSNTKETALERRCP
jgi:hypothetical protein